MRYRIGADDKSWFAMEMDTGSARAVKRNRRKRNPRLPENQLNSGRWNWLAVNMAAAWTTGNTPSNVSYAFNWRFNTYSLLRI